MSTQAPKLAVLIDADNASATIIAGLLAEVARYGTASIKRIYGDWTSTRLNSWKNTLLEHSIQPIQQFGYTTGKNATDSAMIIDAMDLLYTSGYLDGFCIVSSDSDFTRLVSRLREAGKTVYGFGEQKTPLPFRSACDRFIYTEILGKKNQIIEAEDEHPAKDSSLKPTAKTAQTAKQQPKKKDLSKNKKLIELIKSAVDAASDDTGGANLSVVGSYISKVSNDFDSRTYGYPKLLTLIEATQHFEITKSNNSIIIRPKS